jgi:hypothetical protein
MSFPIVGERFTPEEFRQKVKNVDFTDFKPEFVVIHNTFSPTLEDRPNGFTKQHMKNLMEFFADEMHFKAGPHLFIDDNGIWIFNPLNLRGTHSPSWNKKSWGIEMLGNFDEEKFTSGRGAQVAENAVQAAAAMCMRLGVEASTIHFHKEDPLTDHKDCPGKTVDKEGFLKRVEAAMDAKNAFTVFYEEKEIGLAIQPPEDRAHAYTPVRPLLNAIFGTNEVRAHIGLDQTVRSKPKLLWDDKVAKGKEGETKDQPVKVFIREPGVAWAGVRGIVDWLQIDCTVSGRKISLTKRGGVQPIP